MERDHEYIRWYPLKWQPLEPEKLNPLWRPQFTPSPELLAIYIHFPFCKPPCDYCPYLKENYKMERVELWLNAVKKHLILLSEKGFFDKRLIRCIYWGGGTPSLASIHQIESLMKLISDVADITEIAEISFEARPDPNISDYLLSLYETIGLTRCSFGIQSFNPSLLKRLGSHANIVDFEKVFSRISKKIIVSVDLIYNIPSQTMQNLQNDLIKAINIGTDQISVYELILTPNEKLWGNLNEYDKYNLLIDSNEMYDLAVDICSASELHPVLVSDFARPEKHSVYQVEHWKSPQLEVLGLGPGAISYVGGYQFANFATIDSYVKSVEKFRLPILAGSVVSIDEEAARNYVLGFKALQINLEDSCIPLLNHAIKDCEKQGWIKQNKNSFVLTKKGMWYVDNVSKYFFTPGMSGAITPCEEHLLDWTDQWIQGKLTNCDIR